jgi:hypothetical protein
MSRTKEKNSGSITGEAVALQVIDNKGCATDGDLRCAQGHRP